MNAFVRASMLALAGFALCASALAAEPPPAASTVSPNPHYETLRMEIDINKPAKEVWAKVGKYCDIAEWLKLDCKITAGDGKSMGTVRDLAGGRVKEILVAQTELAYGYTQPVREGRVYDLYHGFMEARPVTAKTSKMIYTLMFDNSMMADDAARAADIAKRKENFTKALQEMKRIAEAK
jgi:polyketide cyclase/dehydrase/lipid transport protein